ncbi:hypothetical protein ACVWZX_004298, partial [Deinococcus sp. UYEF24]
MIGIRCVAATAAHELGLIHPVRLFGMPASVAFLRRIARVNRYHPLSGAFCLESKYLKELTPPNIMDTASQIPASHPTDVEIFMGNQVIFIDQFAGLFVVEIQPLTTHLAVQLCDHPHRFSAGIATLVRFATDGTLSHTQLLHGVLEMPGIVDELPIGGDEKMRCTHVNTDAWTCTCDAEQWLRTTTLSTGRHHGTPQGLYPRV